MIKIIPSRRDKFLILIIISFICFSSCKHKKNDSISNEKLFQVDSNSFGYSADENKTKVNDSSEASLIILEEMPIFPGGEKALLQFISSNINYPQTALQDSIEGRVYLKFVVKADGSVNNVDVIKSVRYDLDNECKRVINMLPRFQPGKLEGKPVPVWYAVPITFALKKNIESKGVLVYPKNEHLTPRLNLKLYPNPAKEFIKIELSELPKDVEYNIISLNGQILKTGLLTDIIQTINIQDLTNGIYVFNLKVDRSIFQSQKVVIKK
jgi:TonB family protein